jgi:3-phenylpropionate/trans-cinnamate dioxygenase ferredoxin reductase component
VFNEAMSDDVIVVGNGVSGFACSARLASAGLAVTMIGPGLPHDRPPLSKRSLLTGKLPLLADEQSLVDRGITHIDGLATHIDLAKRTVTVQPSAGGLPVTVETPRIVWATGLRYPRPPVPGLESADENSNAVGLRSLVGKLRQPGRRVVVVGAGLIGTETAATLAADHRVTLLDMVDRPLARFLPQASDAAGATLERLGVRFRGLCMIDSAEAGEDGWVIHTSTHGDLDCDVVISAAGISSSLPAEFSIGTPWPLTLAADETLQVLGHENLWACGDCVSFPHPRWGRLAIPHWDHAVWSGRHVADSIMGSPVAYARDPYFFSDVGPTRIQQVGLADRAVEWTEERGLHVGRDPAGRPACVLLLDAAPQLLEARELIAGAA